MVGVELFGGHFCPHGGSKADTLATLLQSAQDGFDGAFRNAEVGCNRLASVAGHTERNNPGLTVGQVQLCDNCVVVHEGLCVGGVVAVVGVSAEVGPLMQTAVDGFGGGAVRVCGHVLDIEVSVPGVCLHCPACLHLPANGAVYLPNGGGFHILPFCAVLALDNDPAGQSAQGVGGFHKADTNGGVVGGLFQNGDNCGIDEVKPIREGFALQGGCAFFGGFVHHHRNEVAVLIVAEFGCPVMAVCEVGKVGEVCDNAPFHGNQSRGKSRVGNSFPVGCAFALRVNALFQHALGGGGGEVQQFGGVVAPGEVSEFVCPEEVGERVNLVRGFGGGGGGVVAVHVGGGGCAQLAFVSFHVVILSAVNRLWGCVYWLVVGAVVGVTVRPGQLPV